MDEKELELLFKAINSKFDVGDFNTFKSKMSNTESRKRFYDVVNQEGLDLGDYNEYEQRLSGVKKKEPSVAPSPVSEETTPSLLPTPLPEEANIPTIEVSDKELGIDPFEAAKEYKRLKEEQILPSEQEMLTSRGMAKPRPNEAKIKEANDLREQWKSQKGIDLDELYEETKDLSDSDYGTAGFSKKELLEDREKNRPLFERKVARRKWKTGLENKLSEILDGSEVKKQEYDNALGLVSASLKGLNYSQSDFNTIREATNTIRNTIDNYASTDAPQLKEKFAVEVAKAYGTSFKKNFDQVYAQMPESKFLDKDAALAYMYLQDVDPEKAEQYKRLFIDKKEIEGDANAKKGYDMLMMNLKETGLGLQRQAINEELNNYSRIAEKGGLSEEQLADADRLQAKLNELNQREGLLDTEYPQRKIDKVDDAVLEILGPQFNVLTRKLGEMGKGGINTLEGLWIGLSRPFMSEKANDIRDLIIMGETSREEKLFKLPTSRQGLANEEFIVSEDFKPKIDEIKNNNNLSDEEKYSKLWKLLYENQDKFQKVPVKDGKLNISPSTILEGVGSLAASLFPFIATAPLGGAGAAGRFLTTLTTGFAATFYDNYSNALKEGKSGSEAYKMAMVNSAIDGAVIAGAGTVDKVRAMIAGTKTSAAKVLEKMSDDYIQSIINRGAPKGLKAIASQIKERARAIPGQLVKGAEEGAKFEAVATGGEMLKSAISQKEFDPKERLRQSVLATINFAVLSPILGQLNFKTTNQLDRSNILTVAKDKAGFLRENERLYKEGIFNEQQYEQRKELIEKAGSVFESIVKRADLTKKLTEDKLADYLFNALRKDENSKSVDVLPPKQAAEAEREAMVADYKNQFILDGSSKSDLEKRQSEIEKELAHKAEGEAQLSEKLKKNLEAESQAIKESLEEGGYSGAEEISKPIELSTEVGKLYPEKEQYAAEPISAEPKREGVGTEVEGVVSTKEPTAEQPKVEGGIQPSVEPTGARAAEAATTVLEPLKDVEVESTTKALEGAIKDKIRTPNDIPNTMGTHLQNITDGSWLIREGDKSKEWVDLVENSIKEIENIFSVVPYSEKTKSILKEIKEKVENDNYDISKEVSNLSEATKKEFYKGGEGWGVKEISEAYHKAKADGSNPKLVEAVEELLAPTKEAAPQEGSVVGGEVEAKKADIEKRRQEELSALIPQQKQAKGQLDFSAAFSGWLGRDLYEKVFNALQKGETTVAGIKEPLIGEAKPYFEKGLIKSAEDVFKYVNGKDINAKYDAELKAVEQSLKETPKAAEATPTPTIEAKTEEAPKAEGEKVGVEAKPTEPVVEKTALEKATEARKAAKARLDSLKRGLGVNEQAKLEALVDYHRALVAEAKEFIKEKVDDINEWAKSIGEKVDIALQKAWDEAKGAKPIEKAEDLGYGIEDLKITGEGKPPTPPIKNEWVYKGSKKERERAVVTHLKEAKEIPSWYKKELEKRDDATKYQVANMEEAAKVGKGVVDSLGVEDALEVARTGLVHPSVGSAIYGESLNTLFLREQQARKEGNVQEADRLARQWAETSIEYAEQATAGGQFNAQIAHFYKTSPMGIVMRKKLEVEGQRKEWFDKNEASIKEVYEELKKTAEGEKLVREDIEKVRKEERQKERAEKKAKVFEKIDKTIAKWIDKLTPKTTRGVEKQGVGTEEILKALGATMKKAYELGEAIDKIIEDAKVYLKDKLNISDKEADDLARDFAKEITEKEVDLESRYREQIAELERRITEKDFSAEKYKEKKTLTEKEQAAKDELKEVRDRYNELKKQSPEYIEKTAKEFLDRFRNKLKGLNDKQKKELITNSVRKLVESGALKYEDLKQMVADVLGYKEFTTEQIAKIEELTKKINDFSDVENKMVENPTKENIKKFEEAEQENLKAQLDLAELTYVQNDIISTLKAIYTGGLLGTATLIKNIGQNVIAQWTLRLPKAVVTQLFELGAYGIALIKSKWSGGQPPALPTRNIFLSQKGYFKYGGVAGTRIASFDFLKGVKREDIFSSKEYRSTLSPRQAVKELKLWKKGELILSNTQIADRVLRSTIGWQADFILRSMGFGDTIFRYAAQSSKAIQIAVQELGLKDNTVEIEVFLKSPQKYSYKIFREKGIDEKKAIEMSKEVEEAIAEAGKEAVFQQETKLSQLSEKIEKGLKPKKDEGVWGKTLKGLTSLVKTKVFPFVKIPSNVYWSYFKAANPYFTVALSMKDAAQARRYKLEGKDALARKYEERSLDNFAHAIVGFGMIQMANYWISQGLVKTSEDEKTTAKEREGERLFGKQNKLNLGKIIGNEDFFVDLSWFGPIGTILDTRARMAEEEKRRKLKWEVPEQGIFDELLDNLGFSAAASLNTLVFDQAAKFYDAFTGDENKRSQYAVESVLNIGNMVTGATIPAMSKAMLPYEVRLKGENIFETINNNLKYRNGLYRLVAGYPPKKISIWGEPISKETGLKATINNMLGFEAGKKENPFGAIIYDDFVKTQNLEFFPSAIPNYVTVKGKKVELTPAEYEDMQILVGKNRKTMVENIIGGSGTFQIGGKSYMEMGDDEMDMKAKMLKRAYSYGKKVGMYLFMQKYPQYSGLDADDDDLGGNEEE